jgi:hypothetical protein
MSDHTVIVTYKDRDTDERFEVTYQVEAPTPYEALDIAVALWRKADHDMDIAGVPGRGRFTLLGNRIP